MASSDNRPRLFADLEGRRILVTGASSGLGQHFARTLARLGAKVAVAARRRPALDCLAGEIAAAGGESLVVELDLRDPGSVREAVATTERELGPIDVLVNNAGTTVTRSALEHSPEDWDQVVDTNLRGAFLMAQAVATRLRERQQGGSIVNIASILGIRQAAGVVAYAVSKAGLLQLTRTLALEWARYGIRVNAIAPGYVATELNRDFLSTEAGARLVQRIPQRRIGLASDLDGVLALLCSEASSYMTGVVVPVDGGHLVSTL